MLLAPAIKTHCARFFQPATKALLMAVFRQHRCRWWDWPEWCRYTPYHPAVWPCTWILAPGFWRCHSSADSTSSQSTIAALRPGPEQKAQAMSHRPNSPVAQVKRANRSRRHLYPMTWTLQMFGWVFYCLLSRTDSSRTHPAPDLSRCGYEQTVAARLLTIHRLIFEQGGGTTEADWHSF